MAAQQARQKTIPHPVEHFCRIYCRSCCSPFEVNGAPGSKSNYERLPIPLPFYSLSHHTADWNSAHRSFCRKSFAWKIRKRKCKHSEFNCKKIEQSSERSDVFSFDHERTNC